MNRFFAGSTIALALFAVPSARAQDGSGSAAEPAANAGPGSGSGSAAAAETPPPARHPGGPGRFHPRTGMAMKQIVCKPVEAAKGLAGTELAQAIEAMAMDFRRSNYQLTALLQGDPPIACFRSLSDPSKLPRGAR